jgi:hypothetical protein
MLSFMSRHNLAIPMVMDLEIPKTATKATHALKFVVLQSSTGLDAETPMVMVGLTQQTVGKPILTVQQIRSQQNLFNGETPMVMVSAMCLWVLFETIVRKLLASQSEICKVV